MPLDENGKKKVAAWKPEQKLDVLSELLSDETIKAKVFDGYVKKEEARPDANKKDSESFLDSLWPFGK